jgi:Fe2+ transport system protein FeoA
VRIGIIQVRIKPILIFTADPQPGPMLKRIFSRTKAPETPARCAGCPLAACANGCSAAVLRMECDDTEAHRLRGLGLFEGSCVRVLDSRNGMLLEVKGSRLALGRKLADAIHVLPLGA